VTRVLVRSVLALVLMAAAGVVLWRVLAPAEVLAPATDPYPAAVRRASGVIGELAGAPLIVDGRFRVYGLTRQIKADAPVDGKAQYTPRWSFRRWPQRLAGVVATGSIVVSRWSDGQIVAIDGHTGRIAWRLDGPPAGGFTDGATAVWAPPGLAVAGATVLVAADRRVRALNAATGAVRWAAGCSAFGFATAGGRVVCGDAVYDAATGAVAPGWPAGPLTPLGCDVAASGCRGVRDAAGEGWLTTGPDPRRARGLDEPGSTVASDLALIPTDEGVVARSALTGHEIWRGPAGTVLGSTRTAVYVLTAANDLIGLDPASGEARLRIPLGVGERAQRWQVAGGYVAVSYPDSVMLAAI
jgi:hypothetical protein